MTNVIPSEDGLIRRIMLRTSSNRSLKCDVRKIVLLEREGEDQKVEEVVARRSLAYVVIGEACRHSSCLLAVIVAVRDL